MKLSSKNGKSLCVYKDINFFNQPKLQFDSEEDVENSFLESITNITQDNEYCIALSSGYDSNNILFGLDKLNKNKPNYAYTINSNYQNQYFTIKSPYYNFAHISI